MTTILAVNYDNGCILGADTLAHCDGLDGDAQVAKIGFVSPYVCCARAGRGSPSGDFEYYDRRNPWIERYIKTANNEYFDSKSVLLIAGLTKEKEVKTYAKVHMKRAKCFDKWASSGSGMKYAMETLRSEYVKNMNKNDALQLCRDALSKADSKDKHTGKPFDFVIIEPQGIEIHSANVMMLSLLLEKEYTGWTVHKDWKKDFYKIYDER